MVYCPRTDCIYNGESFEDNRICTATDIEIDLYGQCISYHDED
jgi:hypothetical protein